MTVWDGTYWDLFTAGEPCPAHHSCMYRHPRLTPASVNDLCFCCYVPPVTTPAPRVWKMCKDLSCHLKESLLMCKFFSSLKRKTCNRKNCALHPCIVWTSRTMNQQRGELPWLALAPVKKTRKDIPWYIHLFFSCIKKQGEWSRGYLLHQVKHPM